MSFNLRQFKKKEIKEVTRVFHRHVIFGSGLYAFSAYLAAVEKFGKEEVLLVSDSSITEDDYRLKGPTTVRGDLNISTLKELKVELDSRESMKTPQFFKELKLRDFGGRAKNETLLFDEDFYVDPGLKVDANEVFPKLYLQDNRDLIEERLFKGTIKELRSVDPDDLIKNNQWEIELTNGTIIEAETLTWTSSADHFTRLYANKNQLSTEFVEAAEHVGGPSCLYFRLETQESYADFNTTLFIPLSYTHEWGHFVGEFSNKERGQSVEFISFLNKDDSSEEEISKKIGILRRNLEKIFPSAKKISFKEYLILSEEVASRNVNDEWFDRIQDEVRGLKMVGINAPLGSFAPTKSLENSDRKKLSALVRGLLSLKLYEQSI